MTPEAQQAAISEVVKPKLFVIHKPIHDPFGYYREKGHGYTTLAEAWRVTEEVGKQYIGGRSTDPDRVILEPAPSPDYLTDLNAMHEAEMTIANAKGEMPQAWYSHIVRICGSNGKAMRATAAQRREAFLRTLGLWQD